MADDDELSSPSRVRGRRVGVVVDGEVGAGEVWVATWLPAAWASSGAGAATANQAARPSVPPAASQPAARRARCAGCRRLVLRVEPPGARPEPGAAEGEAYGSTEASMARVRKKAVKRFPKIR